MIDSVLYTRKIHCIARRVIYITARYLISFSIRDGVARAIPPMYHASIHRDSVVDHHLVQAYPRQRLQATCGQSQVDTAAPYRVLLSDICVNGKMGVMEFNVLQCHECSYHLGIEFSFSEEHPKDDSQMKQVSSSSSLCAIRSQQVGCHGSPSFSILCHSDSHYMIFLSIP